MQPLVKENRELTSAKTNGVWDKEEEGCAGEQGGGVQGNEDEE